MERRTWLRLVPKAKRAFVPLVGEEVVYMGKGHAEVIEELGRVIRGGTKKGGRDVDMVGCSSFSFV